MKRNPIARSLRNAALRPRIVRARKGRGSYQRKPRTGAS
jgi:stalled ribosome alternative rescue factor ArfA